MNLSPAERATYEDYLRKYIEYYKRNAYRDDLERDIYVATYEAALAVTRSDDRAAASARGALIDAWLACTESQRAYDDVMVVKDHEWLFHHGEALLHPHTLRDLGLMTALAAAHDELVFRFERLGAVVLEPTADKVPLTNDHLVLLYRGEYERSRDLFERYQADIWAREAARYDLESGDTEEEDRPYRESYFAGAEWATMIALQKGDPIAFASNLRRAVTAYEEGVRQDLAGAFLPPHVLGPDVVLSMVPSVLHRLGRRRGFTFTTPLSAEILRFWQLP
jgi:hypothetical protein